MQKLYCNEEHWRLGRYSKWLRGKGKSTNQYKVQCDAQTRTGTKRGSGKADWQ